MIIIGIPITELFVWGFLKGMVIGLGAVLAIWGVAALVEWGISKRTNGKGTHHHITTDISQNGERPVVHVQGPVLRAYRIVHPRRSSSEPTPAGPGWASGPRR